MRAHYTRRAFTLRGGELRLAKMAAPVRFVWSWPDADVTALDPAMVIIARESDGRWYVTFTVDAIAPAPLQETRRVVGVDLGVTDFAATSDGGKIANQRYLECKACRLARYQRRLARAGKAWPTGASAEQQTAQWKARYGIRVGIEGTISQAVRRTRLRRTPYRGQARTHLANVLSATAINLIRVDAWLDGTPLGATRVSHLARLDLAA